MQLSRALVSRSWRCGAGAALLFVFAERSVAAQPQALQPTWGAAHAATSQELATSPSVPGPHPPVIAGLLPRGGDQQQIEVLLGQPLSLTLLVSDADGDPLTVNVVPLPEGAQFDTDSRTLIWTPGVAGDQVVRFVASDGVREASHTVLLRVQTPLPGELPPARAPQQGTEPVILQDPYESSRDPSWESFLLPGAGYALYAPRGAGIGVFHGLALEVVIGAWIHQNDNRGPSHGRVYVQTELLRGDPDQPIAFVYSFGTSLSFERNPRRTWLVPHYGVEFGGLISDTLGSHFQTTPYFGLHIFSSPNVFANIRSGYRLLPGELETLGGPHVASTIDFSVW